MVSKARTWFAVLLGLLVAGGLVALLLMPRRHVYLTLVSPDGKDEAVFYLMNRSFLASFTNDTPTADGMNIRDRASGLTVFSQVAIPARGLGTNEYSDFWLWFNQQTNTVFQSSDSIATLTQTASAPSLSIEERATAIFSIFARDIRLNMTSAQVAAILSTPTWLAQCKTVRVDWRAKVPVKITQDSTIYWLSLFPARESEETGRWSICFRLSGGHGQQENIGEEFLNGKIEMSNVRIVEYALCYVGKHNCRREVFSEKGTSVYTSGNGVFGVDSGFIRRRGHDL